MALAYALDQGGEAQDALHNPVCCLQPSQGRCHVVIADRQPGVDGGQRLVRELLNGLPLELGPALPL
jgi:hypothetical protein